MPASDPGPVPTTATRGAPSSGPDDPGRRRALTLLVSVWVLMIGFVAVQTILPDGSDPTPAAIEVERCEGAGCYAEVRSVDDGFLFRATCVDSADQEPTRLIWSFDGETVASEVYDPQAHGRDPQGRVLVEHVYSVPSDGSSHELVLTCHYPDGSSDGAAARVAVHARA